jgi:spore coat protein U-like protein
VGPGHWTAKRAAGVTFAEQRVNAGAYKDTVDDVVTVSNGEVYEVGIR